MSIPPIPQQERYMPTYVKATIILLVVFIGIPFLLLIILVNLLPQGPDHTLLDASMAKVYIPQSWKTVDSSAGFTTACGFSDTPCPVAYSSYNTPQGLSQKKFSSLVSKSTANGLVFNQVHACPGNINHYQAEAKDGENLVYLDYYGELSSPPSNFHGKVGITVGERKDSFFISYYDCTK